MNNSGENSGEEHSRQRNRFPLLCAVGFYCILSSGACAWLFLRGETLRFLIGSSCVKAVFDILLGAILALLIVALTVIASSAVPVFKRLESFFFQVLGPLGTGEIFLLALLSSIGEELFFRGVLQPEVGLVFASLIFGLLHTGPNRIFLPWTIFAVGTGFLLGYLFQVRGSLLAPMALHFTVNFINLHRICRGGEGKREEGREYGMTNKE